jgi:methylated-DNA-[protein]-cysteine S-methyltransferase
MTEKTNAGTKQDQDAEMLFARYESPVGPLLLVGSYQCEGDRCALALSGIYFADAPHAERAIPAGAREHRGAFGFVIKQLVEYFEGERDVFSVALAPVGTPFQRAVWQALRAIPYGKTATYADIAASIGRPKAVRAVGAANGRNPLSIVVPCHRVIGRDGTLTGYAGGLAQKQKLLALEKRQAGLRLSRRPVRRVQGATDQRPKRDHRRIAGGALVVAEVHRQRVRRNRSAQAAHAESGAEGCEQRQR